MIQAMDISAIAADILALPEKDVSLTSSRFGGNNQGYILSAKDTRYFVKVYFRDDTDLRNRGKQESMFSSFLWQRGVRCIPKLHGYDDAHAVGVFQFLEGQSIRPEMLDTTMIDRAASFFRSMNRFREDSAAAQLPPASESCFSIQAHIELVERRLKRLGDISTAEQVDREAKKFVSDALMPEANRVLEAVRKAADTKSLSKEISAKERCLSPSDFGFHNACVNGSDLCFFDFEYAGWDDPAKMVCDFFHQPKVPVPLSYFDRFLKSICEDLQYDASILQDRVQLLAPLYGIKWCCIMLNDFSDVGNRRRLFAGHVDSGGRKEEQLRKATEWFQAKRP